MSIKKFDTQIETQINYSEKFGKKLYKQNENYRAIANLMENEEFRKFYDNNFSNWYDIKTILVFLKVYEEIEKCSQVSLNSYQKLHILDQIIKCGKLRSKVCQEIINWTPTTTTTTPHPLPLLQIHDLAS